jgi:hypothetical protein
MRDDVRTFVQLCIGFVVFNALAMPLLYTFNQTYQLRLDEKRPASDPPVIHITRALLTVFAIVLILLDGGMLLILFGGVAVASSLGIVHYIETRFDEHRHAPSKEE